MRRYVHEYQVPSDGFAGFAINAHDNGAGNPNAMFRKAIKLETYARAEVVSEPLNMFDVAPNADGAAALLLTRADLLPPGQARPLVSVGSATASDTLALHDRQDMLDLGAAQLSAGKAMKQASVIWTTSTSSSITICSASMQPCRSNGRICHQRAGLETGGGWRHPPRRPASRARPWVA